MSYIVPSILPDAPEHSRQPFDIAVSSLSCQCHPGIHPAYRAPIIVRTIASHMRAPQGESMLRLLLFPQQLGYAAGDLVGDTLNVIHWNTVLLLWSEPSKYVSHKVFAMSH